MITTTIKIAGGIIILGVVLAASEYLTTAYPTGIGTGLQQILSETTKFDFIFPFTDLFNILFLGLTFELAIIIIKAGLFLYNLVFKNA